MKNFKQEQVAERLNLSRQSLSKWENNHSLPDVHTLYELCNLYGLSIEKFLIENANENTGGLS
ncbi:helix-turn-helix transcriptional regulator [Weissella diestrammenae]|uniref:Helix-turn-helix transcriptional regulator n=2 Tax=Weissella diestrammenae TaxID=1162633 RepID=A0A7G9T4A3_9LACO|nr:helix-turn-helix transcriptional regulator [Weissella diestrammenae]